jgi:hypothetical protein
MAGRSVRRRLLADDPDKHERRGFLGKGALISGLHSGKANASDKRQVLEQALKAMGLDAEITGEFEGLRSTVFVIAFGGRERMIAIGAEIMDSLDPVSRTIQEARLLGIGK